MMKIVKIMMLLSVFVLNSFLFLYAAEDKDFNMVIQKNHVGSIRCVTMDSQSKYIFSGGADVL